MPTPEQVEAVARAWVEDEFDYDLLHATEWMDSPYESPSPPREYLRERATAAIAAYEATRPVVTDEELRSDIERVIYRHIVFDDSDVDVRSTETGLNVPEEMADEIIRAVRARLEGSGDA